MSEAYLSNYEETKWDWTHSAVTKFMNGFKRFDGYIEEKEQVYIGVYGPTQVGKTTFILSLLGIAFDQLNALSKALRGRQEQGKSATVTATIYKKNEGEHFHIVFPPGDEFTCSTFGEVEQVMYQLRMQVYQLDTFSLTPLIIDIPKQYFSQQQLDERVRDLAIIDLPGDDSKDKKEMHHVNRVLKEYISRCKVCIIMEIASKMTGLTKLNKDYVKDWIDFPEQFLILLTRSVTNGSVKTMIENGTIETMEEYLDLYKKELTRVGEAGEIDNAIYPLEFGDSWAELKQTQASLYEKTNPWLVAIFSKLVENLTKINSPEQAVKKLKSMDRYVLKNRKEELAVLYNKREQLANKFSDTNDLVDGISDLLEKEKGTFSRYQHFLDTLPDSKAIDKPYWHLPSWDGLSFGEKKATYLNGHVLGEISDIEEALLAYTDSLNKVIRRFNLQENKQIPFMTFPEEVFHAVIPINRTMNRYFKRSTFQEDVDDAKAKLNKVFIQYVARYKEAVAEVKLQVKQYKRRKEILVEGYETELEEHIGMLSEIQEKVDSLDNEINEAEQEWMHDLERSQQFDLYLMQSFVEQSNHYKEKLRDNHITKEEKWVVHQYWNLLKQQGERIIDHVN
ncbi:hypothetical protein ACUIJN_17015 [Metabacillus halosaccharovorans]|uniref:hypothetical protein n=1 Tax=Metabacillus halosaccharovorans TaxID=930124 RepID=UPI00403DACA0